ncbi:hypothetical protein [Streptomyces sp. NBC_01353]|uniref:hypothetical protein n=1 Tax=Streptomyces sp. NBC_01353 TaxID=2903835 RepID=UPI002E354A67|nr:hypothetical protein [Streptomyces sp. NBC_01353]
MNIGTSVYSSLYLFCCARRVVASRLAKTTPEERDYDFSAIRNLNVDLILACTSHPRIRIGLPHLRHEDHSQVMSVITIPLSYYIFCNLSVVCGVAR